VKSLYLPPELWQEPFTLEGPEAHHLLTVLRAGPGTILRLFDGRGRVGTFVLRAATRKSARLERLTEEYLPRSTPEVYLALGWNKAARRGWVLEKAVELGAAGVLFWQAQYSQGRVPDQPKEAWTSQLSTAAKQCGNPWLPTLATVPGGPRELMQRFTKEAGKYLIWEDECPGNLFDPATCPDVGHTILVLGPEGGLAENEARLFLDDGYLPRSLGRSTLRWETAALLCLGLCYWQGQHPGPDA